MTPSAKIIADSTYVGGPRVTTMEVVIHRFVLAEFNTHRAFSRNSASSRAIPFVKQLKRVTENPAIPLSFPGEQQGMQGGEELTGDDRLLAELAWCDARDDAVHRATTMAEMGVHKSVVNRLLEPFMWHTIVVTSVEWDNFFKQRCSPLAQPEIRAAAEAMRTALNTSEPEVIELGMWHRPYFSEDDAFTCADQTVTQEASIDMANQVSVARCARVSYLTQDGVRDLDKDVELYDRLVSADPAHWSPLEHVCRPALMIAESHAPGNLRGWVQLRHIVSGEFK